MQVPEAWTSDAADLQREEDKRERSPCSFFLSQGHALVLAADYFNKNRLQPNARGGVATKHLHRIRLALFGQLMAAFEYLCKSFVASVIDQVSIYDNTLRSSKWLAMDVERLLLFRQAMPTPGAVLLHPTQGWQDCDKVNTRFNELFARQPITNAEKPAIEQLWVLRHSVAHNAGFVTDYDAHRAGMPALAGRVAAIDSDFIKWSFETLNPLASRIANEVGDKLLLDWLRTKSAAGPEYMRDKDTYSALKLIATCVEGRSTDLPKITKGTYSTDFARA